MNFADVCQDIEREEEKLRKLNNLLKIQEINLDHSISGVPFSGDPVERFTQCVETVLEIGLQCDVVKKYRKFLSYLEQR